MHIKSGKITKKNKKNGGIIVKRRRVIKTLKRSLRSSRSLRAKYPKPPRRSNRNGKKIARAQSIQVPAPVEHAIPSDANVFDTYTMFTFDNSPESRAYVGIDHPIMKKVTVNDYINAIYYANEDLVNNSLKSKAEKDEDIKFARHNFEVSFLGKAPEKSTKDDIINKQQNEAAMAAVKQSEEIDKINELRRLERTLRAEQNRKDKIAALRESSVFKMQTGQDKPLTALDIERVDNGITVGGAAGEAEAEAGAGAAGEGAGAAGAGAGAEAEYETINFSEAAPLLIELSTRLNFIKFENFATKANNYRNTRMGWSHRADTFIKYMFLNDKEFTINNKENTLLGQSLGNVQNYNFQLSLGNQRKHPENWESVTVVSGPTRTIKAKGAYIQQFNMTLQTISPALTSQSFMTSGQYSNEITMMNVESFQGKFTQLSNVQKKHIIYSIIFYIVLRLDEYTLLDLLREWDPHHIRKWLRVNDGETEYSIMDISDILHMNGTYIRILEGLPYGAFYTCYTTNQSTISGNVLLASVSSQEYNMRYFQFIMFLYNKIMGDFVEKCDFTIDTLGHDNAPHNDANKLDIRDIEVDRTKVAVCHEVANQELVTFTPNDGETNTTGHGIFTGVGGIVSAKSAFLYGDMHGDIKYINITESDASLKKRAFIPRIHTVDIVPANITRWIWEVDSRIANNSMDRILGYLSHLVYEPNDIISSVSDRYFEKNITNEGHVNKLVYVGPFDDDPSYPIVVDDENRLRVSYSRVHVWLKTYPPTTKKDHELYFVTRGSKTLHDWESVDLDILNGVLNNTRAFQNQNILRKIFKYIDSCFTEHDSDANKLKIFNALNKSAHGKSIQIFSTGHSLGGFLSLSISHTALCNNTIGGISFTNISGVQSTRELNKKIFLKPYIVPIVFDPYTASEAIYSAFSFLPYARIHSCIDSGFGVVGPTDIDTETVSHEYQVLKMFSIRAQYDDVASGVFLSYLRSKHSIMKFYRTMGKFDIFQYKNLYNAFSDKGLYSDKSAFWAKLDDIRISHNLLQIIGLTADYLFSNTPTTFKTRTKYDLVQNLETTRYSFRIPNSYNIEISSVETSMMEKIIGYYNLKFETRVRTQWWDTTGRRWADAVDLHTIDYKVETNSYTFVPHFRSEWLVRCNQVFNREIDGFVLE